MRPDVLREGKREGTTLQGDEPPPHTHALQQPCRPGGLFWMHSVFWKLSEPRGRLAKWAGYRSWKMWSQEGAGGKGAIERESPEDAEGWRRDAGGSHLGARPRLNRNPCSTVTLGNPVGEDAGALCLQAWDYRLTRHPAEGGAELGRHHGIGRLEGQGHERLQHLCTPQALRGV